MTHVAKHDSEQEWESHAGVHGGIDFLVAWDTVSVDYLFEDGRELVCTEVCRWLELIVRDLFKVESVLARRVLGLITDKALIGTVKAL